MIIDILHFNNHKYEIQSSLIDEMDKELLKILVILLHYSTQISSPWAFP